MIEFSVCIIIVLISAGIYTYRKFSKPKFSKTAELTTYIVDFIDKEMKEAFSKNKKVERSEVERITTEANKIHPRAQVSFKLNKNVFMVDHQVSIIGTRYEVTTSNFIDQYKNPYINTTEEK